ncbi:MAG: hypothetical protein ACLQVF_07200 [Isosphaeraceae bacterium]
MSVAQERGVLDKIRTRGYWRVVIRPAKFDQNRIGSCSDLFPLVEKNSVRFRAWGYPHVDRRGRPLTGGDWVGQETNWELYVEVWRLFLSGQFIHFFAIADDWRDQSGLWPASDDWAPGRYLHIMDSVCQLTEIFEFAARLALTPAGASLMRVEIAVGKLRGRRLVVGDRGGPIETSHETAAADWRHVWQGALTDLIAQPRELAMLAAQDLFACFGEKMSLEILRVAQENLTHED